MSYELPYDTQRLERALRENTSGKPQLLDYNTQTGVMSVQPVAGGNITRSQFGHLNNAAMTKDFGGNDVPPRYDYSEETGNVVEVMPPAGSTPDSPTQQQERQFGTLLGRSFTSTFGCDIAVASERGGSLIRFDVVAM